MSTGRITKVWGVVYSPNLVNTPGNPITDLPSFDLTWNDQARRYEGTYDGFTVTGAYTVTVYAMNEAMIISLPKTTKVKQALYTLYTLYTLTVSKEGPGSGTVTSSPSGIDCGSDCSESYNQKTIVILTAKPDADSAFGGWSGGGCSGTGQCSVAMNADETVTATFNPQQYTLTVNINPSASGSVTKNPDKLTYVYGEQVILTAMPSPGYAFYNWSGDASGTSNPITLTIDSNKTAAANFTSTSVTPPAYNFFGVNVKKSKTASFAVKNGGKTNLSITSAITGTDAPMFKITSGSGSKTIKPGKSLTIKVAFKPTSKGSKSANLEITSSNDPVRPIIDIPLSGTGQ